MGYTFDWTVDHGFTATHVVLRAESENGSELVGRLLFADREMFNAFADEYLRPALRREWEETFPVVVGEGRCDLCGKHAEIQSQGGVEVCAGCLGLDRLTADETPLDRRMEAHDDAFDEVDAA